MIAAHPASAGSSRSRHRFIVTLLYRAGRDISIALLLMLAKIAGLMG